MKWLTRLSTNQILALAAFLLGAGALFANPYRGPRVTVDSEELALDVQRGADQVRPHELADWIIQGRADFRVIDLRDEARFAAYHVPGAENVPMATLPHAELARDEKIVLFSDDGVASGQAWVLLRAKGFRGVYTLTGGLEGWTRDVLFPIVKEGTDAAARARLQAVSAHFGGKVFESRGGASAEPAALPALQGLPAVAPPPIPGPAGATRPVKKKKEGC